jgi:hypothetical protein
MVPVPPKTTDTERQLKVSHVPEVIGNPLSKSDADSLHSMLDQAIAAVVT